MRVPITCLYPHELILSIRSVCASDLRSIIDGSLFSVPPQSASGQRCYVHLVLLVYINAPSFLSRSLAPQPYSRNHHIVSHVALLMPHGHSMVELVLYRHMIVVQIMFLPNSMACSRIAYIVAYIVPPHHVSISHCASRVKTETPCRIVNSSEVELNQSQVPPPVRLCLQKLGGPSTLGRMYVQDLVSPHNYGTARSINPILSSL